MASPTFVSGSVNTGSTGVASIVTAPASIANNDILELHYYVEIPAAGSPTFPSGFSQLARLIAGDAAANQYNHYVAYKRAASESGDYTISPPSGSPFQQACIVVYRGCVTSGIPYAMYRGEVINDGASKTAPPPVNAVSDYTDVLFSLGLSNWAGLNFSGFTGGNLAWTSRIGGTSDVQVASAPSSVPIDITARAVIASNTEGLTAWLGVLMSTTSLLFGENTQRLMQQVQPTQRMI